MATKPRKTAPKAQSFNPMVVAIVATLFPRAEAAAAFKAAQEKLGEASRGLWASIMALVQGCSDVAMLHALLGNGLNVNDKKHVAGEWVDALKAEAKARKLDEAETLKLHNSLKSQISKGRTIGEAVLVNGYVLDPKLGRDKQLLAAQLHTGAKVEVVESTHETEHKAGPEETIEQTIARIGLGKVLHACASILAAQRKSATDAKALEVIGSKYGT
jgi:hypothetical protein